MESLSKILPAEQAKIFFSPAEDWRYVDRTGKLVSVAMAFDIDERFEPPLLLGQQEEFALIEACEIDQVLDLLRENLPKLMTTLSPPDQAAFVSRAIDTAREQGVNSVYKFSLYAAVLLSRGEAFADRLQWAQFLEELQRGDVDLDRIDMSDLVDKRRYS